MITYEVILGEDAYEYVIKSSKEVSMDAETENKIKSFDNDDLVFVEKDLSLPLPYKIKRVRKIDKDFIRKCFDEDENQEIPKRRTIRKGG